jgi:NADH:ubiquinone oxidoreductase subunit K
MVETKQESKQQKKPKSIRYHVVVAIVLYFIDGLCFQQGVITFLITLTFILNGSLKILVAVVKKYPFSKSVLQKMAIYVVCFGAVFTTIEVNNKIASQRAEQVISAVKQYKMEYGQYPDMLQKLVPEYLPSVPKAKYGFGNNKFYYYRTDKEENAILLYVKFPPFGRPTYNFERNSWGYLD